MIGELKPFNTIGREEIASVIAAMRCGPLSGYLGGIRHGGYYVEKLEAEFAGALGAKHAVACNSATSGLLMACMAAGVGPGSSVITTPFTMSATAAAPAFLEADIIFGDIEDGTFCLDPRNYYDKGFLSCKAAIVTNLFGHPAQLSVLRMCADRHFLIEDNAQSPFAMEHGSYAGCIGHIGVFSLNVHKHLQCGEGGICITDDDALADRLRLFRNHGELGALSSPGLNLRMTEVSAAIALAQLDKREQIISERIEIAETLTDMVKGLPGLAPPIVRDGCKHVFYIWALKTSFHISPQMIANGDTPADARHRFVLAMQSLGVPLRAGYVDPLYRLPAFQKYATPCPVAERMHDQELVIYENCAWSPTSEQLKQIGEAFKRAVDISPDMG